MMRLLRFLLFGDSHLHQWETIEKCNIVDRYSGRVMNHDYECRCKVCGRYRVFRL